MLCAGLHPAERAAKASGRGRGGGCRGRTGGCQREILGLRRGALRDLRDHDSGPRCVDVETKLEIPRKVFTEGLLADTRQFVLAVENAQEANFLTQSRPEC